LIKLINVLTIVNLVFLGGIKMKPHQYKHKSNLIMRLYSSQGFLFHLAGIIAIIWFLFRVLPKPDRIQYPCQQMSILIASGYIAFWAMLWSVLFHGLALWIKRVKFKTAAFAPVIFISFLLIFTVTSGVYADIYGESENEITVWDPIPNEPIGTPRGASPGRVVWTWDPDATEEYLNGFWWLKGNNNQEVIDNMFSDGIQGLAGVENDEEAWDILFKHFNMAHGYGDLGYQQGEKIAVKINLNNCWQFRSYIRKDNDRDASPYVVKALLRQLVDKVGIAQEDITIYDASRMMPNWFYRRVYYEEYPALPLKAEFSDIHYVDSTGGAPGREKVEASSEEIYFADESGLTRTLPICVIDAKYIINMPILKRHPIQTGITLSGKNFFGTWIEPVMPVHDYHTSAFKNGNPAPQTDLLAHEHIGGKTLLYIGDGLYATKADHCTIAKFEMYPFNNDWTNSLFFSQDPVAIDSVMYDFLHAEGTNPCEGSQNYLHQSAEPLIGVYDPENDGVYLSNSLGVHEHWNKSVNIFSSDRYMGLSGNGIDFISIGEENANPSCFITKPKEKYVTIFGKDRLRFPLTIVIGDINVEAKVNGVESPIEKVDFYLDGKLMLSDNNAPYNWTWNKFSFFKHTIKTIAYYEDKSLNDQLIVWKFF
jgi:hypothetical protein